MKIGFTDNLDVRRRALELHYGRPLALLATMPGGRETEREIHERFAHLRLGRRPSMYDGTRRGQRPEQFRPSPELMAFIGRPLLVSANPDAVEVMCPATPRTTIINLKGSQELATWLEAIHRKTHIPKAVIVRLALGEWAGNHGHPSIPVEDDE